MTTDVVHDPQAGGMVGKIQMQHGLRSQPDHAPTTVVENYAGRVRQKARDQQTRAREVRTDGTSPASSERA